jgi:hypothetical protein
MRLFEVNDPFQDLPYDDMAEEYGHIQLRVQDIQKRELQYRKQVTNLRVRLDKDYEYNPENWNPLTLDQIKDKESKGFVPQYRIRSNMYVDENHIFVENWIKITPTNQELIKTFVMKQSKLIQIHNKLVDLETLQNKTKLKYQAWKRRQPGYIGRNETYNREVKLGNKIVDAMNLLFSPVLRFSSSKTKKGSGRSVIYLQTTKKVPAALDDKESNIKFLEPAIKQWLTDNGYSSIKTWISKSGTQFEFRIYLPTTEVIEKNK